MKGVESSEGMTPIGRNVLPSFVAFVEFLNGHSLANTDGSEFVERLGPKGMYDLMIAAEMWAVIMQADVEELLFEECAHATVGQLMDTVLPFLPAPLRSQELDQILEVLLAAVLYNAMVQRETDTEVDTAVLEDSLSAYKAGGGVFGQSEAAAIELDKIHVHELANLWQHRAQPVRLSDADTTSMFLSHLFARMEAVVASTTYPPVNRLVVGSIFLCTLLFSARHTAADPAPSPLVD